jgi:hypothetical protein
MNRFWSGGLPSIYLGLFKALEPASIVKSTGSRRYAANAELIEDDLLRDRLEHGRSCLDSRNLYVNATSKYHFNYEGQLVLSGFLRQTLLAISASK